jgi:hypothetical protein
MVNNQSFIFELETIIMLFINSITTNLKMKKFYIIIISTALACILITWILISYEFIKLQFVLVKDVLVVFQIVISIFITYLLYDRFGTSKKLLDKQNELIIDFLQELKKVRLCIYETTEKGVESKLYFGISKNLYFAKYRTGSRKIAVFNSNQFFTELKLINQIIEHPLFPPDLKKTIDIFKFGEMTGVLDHSTQRYSMISFSQGVRSNEENWMYPYDGNMTVKEYLESIENSVEKLEEWINKESSIKIKLNFN